MKEKLKDILKRAFIVFTLVLSIILFFCITDEKPTFADSGFSTSHSSSHRSSHSSRRSSSSRHRSSSSGGNYSGSSSVVGSIVSVIFVVSIMIVCIIIVRRLSKSKNKNNKAIPRINDTEIENEVKKLLPDFNKAEFLINGYKIYCDIQKAWMDFKLDDVKDLITDELYNMYDSQLATLEVKGEQNIMKDFVLRSSYLKDVVKQNDNITITTGYVIEMYDYIADQATGKLIRGEDKHKMRVTYEMKFRKTLNENDKITNCPNCGAKIDMNSSGICEYCGSKIVLDNTKWVLTEKKSLNQYYI